MQDRSRFLGHLRQEPIEQLVLLGHVRVQRRGPGDDLLAAEVVDRREIGLAPRLLEPGDVGAHLLPGTGGFEVAADDVLEGLPDPPLVGVVPVVVGLATYPAAHAHLVHHLQHGLVGDDDSLLGAKAHGYLAMAASVGGAREDLAYSIPELGAGRSLGMGQRVAIARSGKPGGFPAGREDGAALKARSRPLLSRGSRALLRLQGDRFFK